MDRFGDELFSRAALATNEYRLVGRRHFRNPLP
jgi:hypothetical protein